MNRKTIILPVLIGVCLAVGVYTLRSVKGTNSSVPQHYQKQVASYPAPVTSCAKLIKVIKAEIVDAGKPNEVIEVQVENLSDLGIIAISLEATNGTSTYTTTSRSSFKIDKPLVVIKAHDIGNLTISSPFGNVPLQIGGVMYDDGSEDGCVESLKTLHEVKDSEKKKEPLNETIPHSPLPGNL